MHQCSYLIQLKQSIHLVASERSYSIRARRRNIPYTYQMTSRRVWYSDVSRCLCQNINVAFLGLTLSRAWLWIRYAVTQSRRLSEDCAGVNFYTHIGIDSRYIVHFWRLNNPNVGALVFWPSVAASIHAGCSPIGCRKCSDYLGDEICRVFSV